MSDELIGRQLDEYYVESLLGQGGMARVYRARDVKLDRYVALKVVDTPFRADTTYVTRFRREAQAIARLEHPNIVRLYRYGEADGLLYMVMQFVEGADLHFILDSYRQDQQIIEPDQAVRITREVASALDYAHGRGVIHRDVKPANILLNRQGDVLLSDFGLALLVEIGTRGEIFGSPHYIAPEQAISSAGAVPASDLYSLGIILYEMFTGRVPFDASEPLDIALMHMSTSPTLPSEIRPEINPALEGVILKAISKEPGDRFSSGAELARALNEALATTKTASTPTFARATIAQRIASDPDAHSLFPRSFKEPPPSEALQTKTVISKTATPPRSRRISPLLIGCTLLGAAALLILLIGGASLLRLASKASSQLTNGETGQESLTIPQAPSSTSTLSSTLQMQVTEETGSVEETAIQVLASPSPAPTPTLIPATPTTEPITYTLWLAKRGDESLFVVNQSLTGLPLALLKVGNNKGRVVGTEWELELLEQGECVTVWDKRNNDAEAPEGIDCAQVGRSLERQGRQRFWVETFQIYYADQQVGVCEKDEAICVISFAVP